MHGLMSWVLLRRMAQKWLFLHFFQIALGHIPQAIQRNFVYLRGEDRARTPGKMNKTEQTYDRYLGALKAAGEILWYRFEGIKFRLADSTFYSPDFSVMRADGLLEQHEVKGFWTDDARVKIKVAAEQFPVRFVAVKKKGSGWEREYFD